MGRYIGTPAGEGLNPGFVCRRLETAQLVEGKMTEKEKAAIMTKVWELRDAGKEREAQARAGEDLHTLFTAEYTFLTQELEVCAPQDTMAGTSLTKALQ
jgi:hypothetical protein